MTSAEDRLLIYRERFAALDAKPGDGIDCLPDEPGIYCILNRVTGRRYVGLTRTSMRKRALLHRSAMKKGVPSSFLMTADLKRHGYESFVFFALFWFSEAPKRRTKDLAALAALNTERHWAILLGAHIEGGGYNLEVGGLRTAGSRFRDQETKLMRWGSYKLLPGVDMYDPINASLLATWVPGR